MNDIIQRAAVGLVLAFTLSAALGKPLIRLLRERGFQTFHWLKQDVDNRLFYQLHQGKIGTPSMGGLLMLGATTLLTALLFPGPATWIFLVAFVSLSALGLADDVSKALVKAGRRKDDLAATPKFAVQWGLSFVVGGLLFAALGRHSVALPVLGSIELSYAFVVLAAFTVVCTANAANIADGLDGLAGGLAVIALMALFVVAVLRGNLVAAGLSATLVGATLGFLVYNLHPAKVMMGDVGSMALGAGMALVALLTDALVPFVIIAGVFVFELLSSFVQRMALRRGRRVFKIAPFHHHLEACGWPETRITRTFWLVGVALAFVGVLVSLY